MKSRGQDKYLERTLVILKPDTIQRGLIGEIISRFEKKGLKIVAMKMVSPDKDLAKKHYDQPESAMRQLGERTIAGKAAKGVVDTRDPLDIARDIQKKLYIYLSAGPVVAMVIEGVHAVAHVRKIRGHTEPLQADIGSISGDFTIDSYVTADEDARAIRNLVHASGTTEEAENEINIWFRPEEIHSYKLAIDEILYSSDWGKS